MKRRLLLMVAVTLWARMASADAQSLDYQSVWSCDAAKMNWYCEEPPAPLPAPAAPAVPVSAAATDPQAPLSDEDIHTAAQMRSELKRREDLAIMNPNDEAAMRSYIELHQRMQDVSSTFADSWQRMLWQHPEYDYAQRSPSNSYASAIHNEQVSAAQDQQLRELAKHHGLIFFFRSDCPYCHAMAPIMKQIASKYGMEVLGISIDGKPLLPEFAQFSDGRAQAANWGIQEVPALFIGSKDTGDHAPIGFGGMAMDEVINRIFVLTATKPGDNF